MDNARTDHEERHLQRQRLQYNARAERHLCVRTCKVGRPLFARIRSLSCPPSTTRSLCPSLSFNFNKHVDSQDLVISFKKYMLSTAVDLTFDDDEWKAPALPRLYRAASVGNSWGVTSIGRGFDWGKSNEEIEPPIWENESLGQHRPDPERRGDSDLCKLNNAFAHIPKTMRDVPTVATTRSSSALDATSGILTAEPLCAPHSQSPSVSPRSSSLISISSRYPPSRSPSSPRPRRRSSQQRVSLIAGRVSIAPIEPPSPPPLLPPSLHRSGSSSSFLSVAASTGPPSPRPERESFLGGRSISEFVIEGEIGRGAYGLVKRAREIKSDGSLGVRRAFIWDSN